MPAHLHKLFAHLGWADQRVLEALRSAPEVPPDALKLFAHVLGAEHVWLARIHGRAAEVAIWPALSLDECTTLAKENHAAYELLLQQPETLNRNARYQNSTGAEFETPVGDILLHVALHGSYHRGQVARALREGGVAPLPTDYIAWVRSVPSATP